MGMARLAAGASCLVAALALVGCGQSGPPAKPAPVATGVAGAASGGVLAVVCAMDG